MWYPNPAAEFRINPELLLINTPAFHSDVEHETVTSLQALGRCVLSARLPSKNSLQPGYAGTRDGYQDRDREYAFADANFKNTMCYWQAPSLDLYYHKSIFIRHTLYWGGISRFRRCSGLQAEAYDY